MDFKEVIFRPCLRRDAGQRCSRKFSLARPEQAGWSIPPAAQSVGHWRSQTADAKPESRENRLRHRAVDVRQAEVAAGVAVGELLVVQAEEVQDDGVQVVDVGLVFDGFAPVVVGGTVGDAGLDAAARQLDAEPKRIVVAPVTRLRERGPAKFSYPDDERLEFHGEASATAATQRSADSLPASSCCIRLKHAGWQSALWGYARTAFATWPCTSVRRKSRPA